MVTSWGAALGKSMVDLVLRSERPILRRISQKNKENQFVVRGNGARITKTTSCVGDTRYKTQDSRLDSLRAEAHAIFHHNSLLEARSEKRETRHRFLEED